MPHWIDTVAIMYPNGRFYYNVEFASDAFDGNEVVHFKVISPYSPLVGVWYTEVGLTRVGVCVR